MSDQRSLSSPEPMPIPVSSRPIWELVIEDMQDRDRMGREKYGTPLQAHNGRRPLVDAYQEVLDLAVYLRQSIEERGNAVAEADRLRNVCHALEQENRILREDVKGIIDRECQTLAQELADVRAERDRLQAILDQPVVMLFADGREPTRNERHLRNLLAWRTKEAEEAKAEATRLRTLIERDRTGLAAGLAEVRKIVGGYGWLAREDEWMSYEYHERSEKALRQEMADCIDQVEAAAMGALQASGKRVTEAFRPETAKGD